MHNSNLSDSIKDLFKSKGIDLVGFSKIQNIKDFDYMNDWLKNGLHITAMGSDAEQKN